MKFECRYLASWCMWWCFLGVQSFILIPEELPSLLSVLFGSIPPIKKGTDSRIGIGFRIGPNADFQTQFEIGPQLNTQPLGPEPSASSSSRKRQTYRRGSPPTKLNFNSANPNQRWLHTWKQKLKDEDDEIRNDLLTKNDPTVENFSFVNHLRQLYDAADKKSNVGTS